MKRGIFGRNWEVYSETSIFGCRNSKKKSRFKIRNDQVLNKLRTDKHKWSENRLFNSLIYFFFLDHFENLNSLFICSQDNLYIQTVHEYHPCFRSILILNWYNRLYMLFSFSWCQIIYWKHKQKGKKYKAHQRNELENCAAAACSNFERDGGMSVSKIKYANE